MLNAVTGKDRRFVSDRSFGDITRFHMMCAAIASHATRVGEVYADFHNCYEDYCIRGRKPNLFSCRCTRRNWSLQAWSASCLDLNSDVSEYKNHASHPVLPITNIHLHSPLQIPQTSYYAPFTPINN